VTPTSQNLANIERDLRGAAKNLLLSGPPGGDAGLQRSLEMVVRAYDPCISCSVHVVRLVR
jgi:sulfhydrogenase subunit alpha